MRVQYSPPDEIIQASIQTVNGAFLTVTYAINTVGREKHIAATRLQIVIPCLGQEEEKIFTC